MWPVFFIKIADFAIDFLPFCSFFIIFLARNYLKKLIQWAETAKNALKCIQIHIAQKEPKNAKNGKKLQKITYNCKISEITKYGEKMKKIENNVKQCKKCQKRA